jgi:hypothetical protein
MGEFCKQLFTGRSWFQAWTWVQRAAAGVTARVRGAARWRSMLADRETQRMAVLEDEWRCREEERAAAAKAARGELEAARTKARQVACAHSTPAARPT